MIAVSMERKVLGVFVLMFAGLLATTVLAFITTRRLMNTAGWVSHTYAVMDRLQATRAAALQAESAMRGFVITGDNNFLNTKDSALSHLATDYIQLRKMTSDNPVEQRHLDRLSRILGDWRTRVADVQIARQFTGFAAAQALVRARHIATRTAQIFLTLDTMHAEEQRLLDARLVEERHRDTVVNVVYVLLCSLALIFFIGIYLQIRREIRQRSRTQEAVTALNSELKQQSESLEQVNKELESFSYSVSHDLRAPLRAVDGFSRLFEQEYRARLDAEGLRLLGVIRNNAKRMGMLIDDLLAFSRLGRKPVTNTEFDMRALVEEALAEALSGVEAPHPRVEIAALPDVRGDRALLRQVWLNLLANAVKYSSKTPQPRVSVEGRIAEGENIYCVRDNGVGFDMRYYDKLFGVFQRLHSEEQFPGTGVGLAIVQRVILKHDGRVWAEGKPNEGAAFFFSLPNKDLPT